MVAYIPELKLAFESSSTKRERRIHEEELKAFICKKQGIKLVYIPLGTQGTEERVADEIKRGFRERDIFISSDTATDTDGIRKRFFEWKKQTPTEGK